MARVIAGMTQSLDGFIEDGDGSADALYTDLADLQGTDYMQAMIDETGSVLMGRRTFAMGEDPDWYAGNYEFQVPIFVVTHEPPAVMPKQDEHLTFTFVTDGLEHAVELAKSAAGDLAVTIVGGVNVIRELLHKGLVDELRIDVMPVMLGAGRRLLDDPSPANLNFERISTQEIGPRTSLRFRVTT